MVNKAHSSFTVTSASTNMSAAMQYVLGGPRRSFEIIKRKSFEMMDCILGRKRETKTCFRARPPLPFYQQHEHFYIESLDITAVAGTGGYFLFRPSQCMLCKAKPPSRDSALRTGGNKRRLSVIFQGANKTTIGSNVATTIDEATSMNTLVIQSTWTRIGKDSVQVHREKQKSVVTAQNNPLREKEVGARSDCNLKQQELKQRSFFSRVFRRLLD